MITPGWAAFPHLVVRTTGFSFDTLGAIRCPDSGEIARQLHRARAALERYKAHAPRISRPPKAVLSALRSGREIPLDAVPNPDDFAEWNRLARAVRQAEQALEDRFAAEQAQALSALKALAQTPRLQEAVASSSPPVFLDLSAGRWSSRIERQLASYLQRLSAKNETMSFFGPINYGRLAPEGPDGVELRWGGPEALSGRTTYVGAWLVQGIARQVARDPEILPWLVVRKKGFSAAPSRAQRRIQLGELLIREGVIAPVQLRAALATQAIEPGAKLGEVLIRSGYCTAADVERALELQRSGAALGAPQSPAADVIPELVAAADGVRTLRSLCAALGRPLAEVEEYVRIACDRGLLAHQLEIPSSSPHPLHELTERLSGIPTPAARKHLAELQAVLALVARYSGSDAAGKVKLNDTLRELVKATWGVEPATRPVQPAAGAATSPDDKPRELRGEGHNFYADRLPLREECGGDLELEIRGERARELQARAAPALELMGDLAIRTRDAARRLVAKLVGPKKLPFWKVIAALSDRPIPFDDGFTRLAREALSGHEAERTFDLTQAAAALPRARSPLPLVTSIDLLISARSAAEWALGRYELVLGDVHDTALVWGWALQFHPRRSKVEQDLVALVGSLPRPYPLVTALASRRTGLLPSEFPGPVIEVGGVSGRPSPWRLYLDDLMVVSDGNDSRLWSESLQSEVCLYNGELESLTHTAFALPRIRPLRASLEPHTPRLTLGGAVIQREQWQLLPEQRERLLACKTDKDRLCAMAALAEELGMQSVVFAKFKGERKPVLLDIASPLNIRVFLNLLEQKQEVVLSEMLPGPSGLWMAAGGQHHTSELRCVFVRKGEE